MTLAVTKKGDRSMKIQYSIDRLREKVVIRIRIGKITITLEIPP
jgi:hypothetical protein